MHEVSSAIVFHAGQCKVLRLCGHFRGLACLWPWPPERQPKPILAQSPEAFGVGQLDQRLVAFCVGFSRKAILEELVAAKGRLGSCIYSGLAQPDGAA